MEKSSNIVSMELNKRLATIHRNPPTQYIESPETKMSRVEELQLSEICISLQSQEKNKRLKALEKFHNIVTNNEREWTKEELLEIWQIMSKHVAKHLTDSAESCRTLSIDVTKEFLETLPVFEKNIIYLIPVLTRRLGSQEILEPSEEARLNCVILIQVIIRMYKEHLAVYVDDLMTILTRTVVDNYPRVKRESCQAISDLAKSIPAQFYSKSEIIIKPILSNFTHQHYRVRVASIVAIGDVLQYGNSKSMGDVASAMAQRLFDQSGAVRNAVVEVAGDWLLNLRDRYSWWFKLIPLLLTGLHDEIEEIRLKSMKLWDQVGKKYLTENDCDEKIKDKMDFLTVDLEHYPPNIQRPNLGCRLIVQQNIGKLVGGLSKEIDDWIADIRIRSAQLLAVLALNSEQDIMQHIEKLLPSMYKACIDEDDRVTINVITAAEYMGYFIPPETYCRLVLPTLEDGNIHSGHLAVFSGLLRGSERVALSHELKRIGDFLQQSDVCRSRKTKYQEELLKCCGALITVCQEDCSSISRDIFIAVFTVWAMSSSQSIQNSAKCLIGDLSKMTDTDLHSLYINHLPWLLNDINDTASTWHIHSAELSIFKLSLTEGKIAALKEIHIVSSILEKTMNQSSDLELKLKLFIILSESFQYRTKYLTQFKDINEFLVNFLKNIVTPSLIWTAGKSAEALRTAAVGCLCAVLDECEDKNELIGFNQQESVGERMFSDKKMFSSIFGELRPILTSLVDDNSRKTRLFTLRAIYFFVHHGLNISGISEEDIISIYPSILKRLDDGCDDVRSAAVETLVFLWKALPNDYDLEFGKNHLDYLYTTTIVHLDDPEECFQRLMLDAMMELAAVHPAMLADKINKCRVNFRNQEALGKIMKRCHELLDEKKN